MALSYLTRLDTACALRTTMYDGKGICERAKKLDVSQSKVKDGHVGTESQGFIVRSSSGRRPTFSQVLSL